MGLQELGALAGFLGGMQQGKLLKQKKELTAQQLQARKTEAEQRAADRAATALYRGQQLDLGRQNLALSKKRLENEAGKGLQTFIDTGIDTRKAIINAAQDYKTKLRTARDPRTYRAIKSEAIKDLGAQTKILDDLAKREDIANYFGGPDKAQGVFRAGIPSYVFDPAFGDYEPDWNTIYKPDRTELDRTRTEGFNAGTKNVGYYIQTGLPHYQRIVEDFAGDPMAAEKAVQLLGPIRGTTAQETIDLINGKVAPMYLSNRQYADQFDPLAQMGREVIPIYDPETGAIIDQVDETGQSYGEALKFDRSSVLPDPGAPIQRTSAYSQDIPVSVAATRQGELLPYEKAILQDKVVYNQHSLNDRLTKIALENALKEQNLDKGQLDIIAKGIANATNQFKLDKLPEETAAKLEQIYAQTFRTKIGTKVDATKAYEAIKKVFDSDVNIKEQNQINAMRSMMQSPDYSAWVAGDPARAARINAYLANPATTPIPADMGAPLQFLLAKVVEMQDDVKEAKQRQKSVMEGGKDFVTNFNEIGKSVKSFDYKGTQQIKNTKPGASGGSGTTRITGGATRTPAGSNRPPIAPPRLR